MVPRFFFSGGSEQEAFVLMNQASFIIHSIYQLGSVKVIRLATPENDFLLKA